jgi:hypothetical protein
MASVKGTLLLSTQAFVVERWGRSEWERVVAGMSPEDRDVLAEALAMGWYAIGVYERLNRRIDGLLGDGTMALMSPLGRFAAEHDLRTFHRIFLRFANPAMVIEKSAELWRRYQDSGSWNVHRVSPTRLTATLTGWGISDEIACVRLAAYCGRMLELVGAKDLQLRRLQCIGRGDKSCVFDAHWK